VQVFRFVVRRSAGPRKILGKQTATKSSNPPHRQG
jgi:hypothetical protein